MDTADKIHNLPVPERFLPLMTRTLAGAYAAEANAEAVNISPPLEPPTEGRLEAGWTKEEVVRAYREATPALRAAFNYLADRPDKEVNTLELARAVYPNDNDMDARNRLYGVFGGFGSKAEYTYHKKKKDWFFSQHRERMPDGSAGRMIYVMPAEKAAWLREARGRE
jgi:hypothetical protein